MEYNCNNFDRWTFNDSYAEEEKKPEFDLTTMLGQSMKCVYKWKQSEIKRLDKRFKGNSWPLGLDETLNCQALAMLLGMQEMYKLLQKHPSWLTKKPWNKSDDK